MLNDQCGKRRYSCQIVPLSKTVSSPASPSRTHITWHRTLKRSSSNVTSTACPRLKWKLPRNRKPPFDLSITMQGNLSTRPFRLTSKLARFTPNAEHDVCHG